MIHRVQEINSNALPRKLLTLTARNPAMFPPRISTRRTLHSEVLATCVGRQRPMVCWRMQFEAKCNAVNVDGMGIVAVWFDTARNV